MDLIDSRSECEIAVSNPRSPSKVAGEKRIAEESIGRSEIPRKRIKMRDLEEVLNSRGTETCHSELLTIKEATTHAHLSNKKETSQVTDCAASVVSNGLFEATTVSDPLSLLGAAACFNLGPVDSNIDSIDLKTKEHNANKTSNDPILPKKIDKEIDLNVISSSGLGVDLNAEDVSSMIDQNPFYPYKSSAYKKPTDDSECGSTTGPLEENEPLRMWKAMKQNGFLSSSHGGIPVPKRHGQSRKSKNDMLKKKIEVAKREQANRFTKIAGPSGLLAGLNPGIINHVRNSKQVHSIIEAIVKSERTKGIDDGKKDPGDMHNRRTGRLSQEESVNALAESRATRSDTMFSNRLSVPSNLNYTDGAYESDKAEKNIHRKASHFKLEHADRTLMHQFSSVVTMASENASSVSSEEFSAKHENITSLSIKAATVAAQWLELLHQDLRGRLAALRRSKKRVRNAIRTELPSLLSGEFSSNQENDPDFGHLSASGCSKDATPNMHMARWRSLFDQMEKALLEEGKHLENWLRQVKEMQSHCEQGLQFVRTPGIDSRSKKKEALDRECAVRAAAASIYSTCNMNAEHSNTIHSISRLCPYLRMSSIRFS